MTQTLTHEPEIADCPYLSAHGIERLRPFAVQVDDLAVDFAVSDPLALMVQIVAGQGGVPASALDDARISDVIRGLLAVASLHRRTIEVTLDCQRCSETIGLNLPLADLVHHGGRPTGPLQVTCANLSIEVAIPTVATHRTWLRDATPDARALVALLVDEEVRATAMDCAEVIVGALHTADPLVGFTIDVECPECACPTPSRVDLVALCFSILLGAQRQLLDEIHDLASHYHWSEAQIMNLPPWRRRTYRELIAAEAG